MSAFLCNTQLFGVLAHYGEQYRSTKYGQCYGLDVETTDNIIAALVTANMLSLSARYPDDAEPSESWFDMTRADFISQAKQDAKRAWNIDAITILKACDCLEYQSCEYDGWYQSTAYKIVSEIRKTAIKLLPTYSDAQWEFHASALPPVARNM